MNKSNTDRIEKRIELKAPVARVWRALTDYKEFGQWFRVDLTEPFIIGKTTRGKVTYPGYEHLELEVLVQEMQFERRFSFRWNPYDEDPKQEKSHELTTLVEFVLEATDTGTLLLLSESGFDALPAEGRDEAFRRNDGGWTEQMQNIKAHVNENG